jgi:4-carboxymuconolactone decarboxylase
MQSSTTLSRVTIMICLALSSLGLTGEAYAADSPASGFSPRPTMPRVPPVPLQERTAEQKAMLASRPDYNIYTTLAHHTELYSRWSPLGQYILNGSGLPARDREILMLRMGWLCQSEYEWSQHARIAKGEPGLSDADIRRIALGAEADGWSDFERGLLKMVDELRYEAMVSDATWRALSAKYSPTQIMDALYTAAQYQLVSMALNSLGVQLDASLQDRLPTGLSLPKPAGIPSAPRLGQPRIKPLTAAQWSPEQRQLIAPQIVDGNVSNLYATMINHPTLYGPRYRFGSYLQRDSKLPPQTRELLIMRTAWLIRSEYEWAHHVQYAKSAGFTDVQIERIAEGSRAAGWSEEHAAVLRAAEELRREAFISDGTWATLNKYYDTKLLFEIIYTVGGYTMTGLAINSFGVQIEPGFPGFPPQSAEHR